MTKKELRGHIDWLERYNDYLKEQVNRWHDSCCMEQRRLKHNQARHDQLARYLAARIHGLRRDDESTMFATGWNQAIARVEAAFGEELGEFREALSNDEQEVSE